MLAEASSSPIVVKIGGSLYGLAKLGSRLHAWLQTLPTRQVILVPGGGVTVHVIRELDRRHSLGEERAHWIALAALSVNARFLEAMVPDSRVVSNLAACRESWPACKVPILDAGQFAIEDEGQPGSLPHSWAATSDSIAARVAVRLNINRLILLKSANLPTGVSLVEASRRGYVDRHFAVAAAGLAVDCVNFREWSP